MCVLNMGMRRQLLKVNTLNKGKPGNVVKVNTYFFNKVPIILIQFDKSDKMGTIGVAESEQITLAFEYATQKKMPVIAVIASGGIRVNEGTLALMQMAKMAAAVKQHSAKGLLYISVVTTPTLGGASVHSAVLSGRWCGDQRPLCGPAAGECQSVEFGFITTV